jgi:fructose-1-phosphate kinase PfkB-like protein
MRHQQHFSAGMIVYRDPSATTYDWYGGLIAPVDAHQPKVMVLGVAQHAIAAGSFGFILKRGVGSITAGGAHLTADSAFTSGGATVAGRAITWADGTNAETIAVIGHTAAQINTTTTGTAWIDCG